MLVLDLSQFKLCFLLANATISTTSIVPSLFASKSRLYVFVANNFEAKYISVKPSSLEILPFQLALGSDKTETLVRFILRQALIFLIFTSSGQTFALVKDFFFSNKI